MNEEINQLKRELENLKKWKASVESGPFLPLNLEKALVYRGFVKDTGSLSVSAKGANDEDQAVNEAGAASYSVMGDPDGFLEIVIDGVTYYLPYFS